MKSGSGGGGGCAEGCYHPPPGDAVVKQNSDRGRWGRAPKPVREAKVQVEKQTWWAIEAL